MPRFVDLQPQLQVVNSVGAVIEGPYRIDVASGAAGSNPPGLGIVLDTAEPWYQEESIGPFLNYQWSEIAYLLGYRYYVNLNFACVEGAASQNFYGLTLLDQLYQICAATQVPYAALQFSLFVGSPFFGVVPAGGGGFHPQKIAGKQGFYSLTLQFRWPRMRAA